MTARAGSHGLSITEVWNAVEHYMDESGIILGFQSWLGVRDILLIELEGVCANEMPRS